MFVASGVCTLFISCGQVPMEDISLDPKYAGVIGQKFRTGEDLWAIGVTSDVNYAKKVAYIVLVPGVGFSGPEVVSRERIQEGFVICIVGVLRARSVLASNVEYVVEEVGTQRFKDSPIRVTQTGPVEDGNLGLNNSIFRRVD